MNIAEYYNYKHSGDKKLKLKAYEYEFDAADRPLILQLAGNKADPIVTLANQDLFRGHIDGVDLNCGCPQGFAMEKKIGACLLRDPDHLVDLARQISESIPYSFSMKLRLHEDGVETTMALLEKLVSSTKVKAFTIHGRFWWQKGEKRGLADWEALRMIRERLPSHIPLIGNGDVSIHGDFDRFKQQSGVDSVMVGYGALLDPTVFQMERLPLETVLYDYLNIARRHYNGLVDVQRHIQWMIKRRAGPAVAATEVKAKLFQSQSLAEIQTVLASLAPNPITIAVPTLNEGEVDKIKYPKTIDEMTPKELKLHTFRQQKNEAKLVKKLKRQETANAEAIHQFSSDLPSSSSAPSSAHP
jgi:tRNA-dihydrouridine synthase